VNFELLTTNRQKK